MHTHKLTPVIVDVPLPPNMKIDGPVAKLPTCENCGTVITCGCQRVTATDGKEVCDDCVEKYQQSLSNGFVD
jgi:hypothetical protein